MKHTPTTNDVLKAWVQYRQHTHGTQTSIQDAENEFYEFIAAAEQRGAIKALRRVAKDLEWLGAQGNIPTPDTSWQGVLECIRIINSEALTIEYRADRIANKEGGE